jgi:TRAP-type C4-dicarboxylate transport system permease small subunit
VIHLFQVIRALARYMYWLAGGALAGIVFLTVADVLLRIFAQPIVGTYELVGFLGAWAIGLAIPQTSLDRGQVFMEFLV